MLPDSSVQAEIWISCKRRKNGLNFVIEWNSGLGNEIIEADTQFLLYLHQEIMRGAYLGRNKPYISTFNLHTSHIC